MKIDIVEDFKVPGTNIILEKGDVINVVKESISVANIKRGEIRDEPVNYSPKGAYKLLQLTDADLVGWFANKYNMAAGWSIWKPNDYDRAEFGQHVFRTYSEDTDSTSIIQFNIVAGTYAFLDQEAYLRDEIKFEKMTAYDRIIIEPTPTALEEFDIAFR